jgi:glycosyltransferase involved in cell wall biosynthesis
MENALVVKTTYENYEILLVDNGSDDPKALAYFQALSANSRITVIRDD